MLGVHVGVCGCKLYKYVNIQYMYIYIHMYIYIYKYHTSNTVNICIYIYISYKHIQYKYIRIHKGVYVHPKTNMKPENHPFEKEKHLFGFLASFREGNLSCHLKKLAMFLVHENWIHLLFAKNIQNPPKSHSMIFHTGLG